MLTRVFKTIVIIAALTVAACSGKPQSSESGSTPSIPPPPDVAAPPADAIRTPTGLASKVLSPGTGTRHPRPNSQVVVHYTGWTTDGKMFDSSVARGEPASFSLDGVMMAGVPVSGSLEAGCMVAVAVHGIASRGPCRALVLSACAFALKPDFAQPYRVAATMRSPPR